MLIAAFRYIFVKQNNKFDLVNSVKILSEKDKRLNGLFTNHEVNDLKPEKNYLKSLIRSIIYQQLSASVAKKIFERFISVFPGSSFPDARMISSIDIEILRASGISYNKSHYIKNIANAFITEKETFYKLNDMSDNDIINTLTKIKGIGPWTAQMFLMFTLNRPDVFPASDLAMQKGYQIYFELDALPKASIMLDHSQVWIPYRTTVSLYLWSVLEGPFEW